MQHFKSRTVAYFVLIKVVKYKYICSLLQSHKNFMFQWQIENKKLDDYNNAGLKSFESVAVLHQKNTQK
jgi:hypothetical protein